MGLEGFPYPEICSIYPRPIRHPSSVNNKQRQRNRTRGRMAILPTFGLQYYSHLFNTPAKQNASSAVNITAAMIGLPSDRSAKWLTARLTFVSDKPIMASFASVRDGAVGSRSQLVAPGTKTSITLRNRPSSDYFDHKADDTVFSVLLRHIATASYDVDVVAVIEVTASVGPVQVL